MICTFSTSYPEAGTKISDGSNIAAEIFTAKRSELNAFTLEFFTKEAAEITVDGEKFTTKKQETGGYGYSKSRSGNFCVRIPKEIYIPEGVEFRVELYGSAMQRRTI